MYTLMNEQLQSLLAIVEDDFGPGIKRSEFAEAMLKLFEDISGFETIPPSKADTLVNQLWEMSMSKNQTNKTDQQSAVADASATVSVIDLNKPVIQQAIKQGKQLIAEEKSKADAARAIYGLIRNESKEVIVAAFVEGATLTEKGALTYWYNCKRRAAREAKKAAN